MFLNDFLYICLSWPAALAHGKIEENIVNSCVFKGLGRSRHWTFFWCQSLENTAKTTVLDRLYAENRVNYSVFDGTHCKNTGKNNGFAWFFVYMFELAKKACGVGGPPTRSGVNIAQNWISKRTLNNRSKTSIKEKKSISKSIKFPYVTQ